MNSTVLLCLQCKVQYMYVRNTALTCYQELCFILNTIIVGNSFRMSQVITKLFFLEKRGQECKCNIVTSMSFNNELLYVHVCYLNSLFIRKILMFLISKLTTSPTAL